MQPTLASFWKTPRVETSSVETVTASEILSDNDDGEDDSDTDHLCIDVVDKGADVVYKGIISSDDNHDSDERCDLNCVVTTDESSGEMDGARDSDIMDSHDTGVVGVELNTDSQPAINLDKAVSVINDNPEFETASSSNSCDAECCSGDRERPYQPRLNYLTVSKKGRGNFINLFSLLGIILLNG